MMSNNCVVVLGLGPAGLFLARQLSRLAFNIYAVGRPDDIGMFTKHVEKSKRYYAVTADEIENAFSDIKHREGKKPVLHVCSDQYLSILLERQERWFDLLDCPELSFETLALINDKNTINTYCHNHGIEIPESTSYIKFKEKRAYPMIIKWVEKRIETAVNPIGKVKICRSEAEFETADRIIREGRIHEEDLFVQTYIEGKNDCQFSIGGYYHKGLVLADVAVNQIKQYPQGISAEVVTSADPVCEELKDKTRAFAKSLSYSGFLEMEYKIDAVTRKIYLLDVNPRPWGWVSILGTVYPDFYKVLGGKAPESRMNDAVWKSQIRVLMGKKNKQNVEPAADVKQYKKAYAIKDIRDLKPSVMICLIAVKKAIRRLKE